MTLFVLDASVTLAWLFEDEASSYADSVATMLELGSATAPAVWQLEVINGLFSAVRRKRLQRTDLPRLLADVNHLRITVDSEHRSASFAMTIVALGLAHDLSSYDASYLELALRLGLPLATEDQRLARAAAAAGVEILQPEFPNNNS